MSNISERVYPNGTRVATVRLAPGERVVVVPSETGVLAFDEENFYRLGGQVDDVVRGHVLAETHKVAWCSVSQQWVDA